MTEKRFSKCEYYHNNDNPSVIGYCTNPVRHKKINGVALLCCQGTNCKLDTKERYW